MNEVGWSFCQQCGGRLPKSATPDSDWKTQVDFKTTPTELPEPEPAASGPVPSQAEPALTPEVNGATPTVVVEPVKPAIPPTPPPEPQQPAAAVQMTEAVPSTTETVICNQCGQASAEGSVFCATCGAPISVARTVVMSSPYAPAKGRLHLVMEGGQLGEVYDLSDETTIGRTGGDISFPHDGFMSGRHARIVRRGGSYVLMDEGSRNGTFVKIKSEVELKPGDMILVGKQLFRFDV